MPQVKQTCQVTENSQVVVVPGVDLTLRIKRNCTFMVDELFVPYTVAQDSTYSDGDTIVTLSGAYVAASNAAAAGVFVADYTFPDMIPTIAQGDVGTAAVFSAAMYRIQEMINVVSPGGLITYANYYNDVLAMHATVTSLGPAAVQAGIDAAASLASALVARDAAIDAAEDAEGFLDAVTGYTADALSYRSATEGFRDQVVTLRNAAEGFRDQASISASNATTASEDAIDAATQAVGARTAAETSASNASGSAAAAAGSAGDAESFSISAEAAALEALLSKDWAVKMNGEVVAGQGYSAKKHAIDAAASAAAALQSAEEASAGQVNSDWNAGAGVARILNKPFIPSTKADIGLGDADNKSSATIRSELTSGNVTTALGFTPINAALIGAGSGIAPLDSGGKIAATYLPAYVDDVQEFANTVGFPGSGSAGIIYVAVDSNKTYRWSGSGYTEISASPGSTDAVTEGASNKYFTEGRVRATILTGISLVTNAAISAADSILSALGKLQKQVTDLGTTKANLAGAAFTGAVSAPSLALAAALPVSSGGTGLSAAPANGQIDIGNGAGFVRTALTAGANIQITNGAGSITIAAVVPDSSYATFLKFN